MSESAVNTQLKQLVDAAMALGRVWGGMAHSSATQNLVGAAKAYYEANKEKTDPWTDSPIECP